MRLIIPAAQPAGPHEPLPAVFVAGKMLDWEAQTGGYLLQACFASGVWVERVMG